MYKHKMQFKYYLKKITIIINIITVVYKIMIKTTSSTTTTLLAILSRLETQLKENVNIFNYVNIFNLTIKLFHKI